VTFAPFDVIVVPFPYSDVLAEKRRPAVVVSASVLEAQLGVVWLAMITSVGGPLRLGDAALTDLTAAGLTVPSRVRAGKLATLDLTRVVRRAGSLAPADAAAVTAALRECAAF
jgi:mRNA interferase MazF